MAGKKCVLTQSRTNSSRAVSPRTPSCSPSNCTLNNAPCAGGGPTNPGAPGTPGNVRVTGTTGSAISLAWNASSGTVTGYRVYDEADVRDARLAHQLRRGGYLLEQIAPLIAQVRAAGGLEPLEGALDGWHARLSARGRAMLTGAAELDAYLRGRG